jgi:hypothetical protein
MQVAGWFRLATCFCRGRYRKVLVVVLIANSFVSTFDGDAYYIGYCVNLPLHRLCGLDVRVPSNRSRGLYYSGQNSWLHILRFRFDSRRYQIFSVLVRLERGPLSLVSTTQELLGRNKSGSGLENRFALNTRHKNWH